MIDLRDVLKTCVLAAVASQQYVHHHILKDGDINSLQIDVKGTLDYKEGEAASDLVTNADQMVQQLVIWALENLKAKTRFEETGSRSSPEDFWRKVSEFGDVPHEMTIVGEEDEPTSTTLDEETEMAFQTVWQDATEKSKQPGFIASTNELQTVDSLINGGDFQNTIVDSKRVAIFIDPIDGTNCFVEGIYHVPMCLIGITLDGEPVAGVTNRVFVVNPPGRSLSFCLRDVALVVDGVSRGVPTEASLVDDREKSKVSTPHITVSKTTKKTAVGAVLDKLEPLNFGHVYDRGAGNKLLKLVGSTVQSSADSPIVSPPAVALLGSPAKTVHTTNTESSADGEKVADVFAAVPGSIKKWDTCAPHAFIRMYGGDVYDYEFNPIRYAEPATEGAGEKKLATALEKGVVGVAGRRQDLVQKLIAAEAFTLSK